MIIKALHFKIVLCLRCIASSPLAAGCTLAAAASTTLRPAAATGAIATTRTSAPSDRSLNPVTMVLGVYVASIVARVNVRIGCRCGRRITFKTLDNPLAVLEFSA